VFFGTSAFSAEVLAFLLKQPICELVAVVTRQDKPRGRKLEVQPSPVKKAALVLAPNCPLLQPVKASTEEFARELQNLNPELFVVVAYGEIIKQNLLDLPGFGCINIHASLLPKYRGAAPIHRAIMNGEKETGVTIIEMVQALDAGPMLNKEVVNIGEDDTFGQLEKKLIDAACRAVLKTIEELASGRTVKQDQQEDLAVYASKLSVEEEKIDWQKNAREIHNLIRSFSPQPGAWCKIVLDGNEKRMKILRSEVIENLNGVPGEILEKSKNILIIACGKGSIKFLEVQLEGKRTMQVRDFLQGLHTFGQINII
jgi:methionyl-tRNA formyltransferase